jgi:flagellar basal-body rod protein FlgB
MSGLIDPTTTVLTQALNGLSDQQAVISANLANIDTPNYQPQSLDFQTALQNEMAAAGGSAGGMLPPSSGPAANVAMEATDRLHYSALTSTSSDSSAQGGSSQATSSGVNENIRNDGNKVDLETEMTALTETQVSYSADSRLIEGRFEQLYDVLGGH